MYLYLAKTTLDSLAFSGPLPSLSSDDTVHQAHKLRYINDINIYYHY